MERYQRVWPWLVVLTVCAVWLPARVDAYNFFEAWPSNVDDGQDSAELEMGRALSINDAGELCGCGYDGNCWPRKWKINNLDSGGTQMSLLAGQTSGQAWGINNGGLTAGFSQAADTTLTACQWDASDVVSAVDASPGNTVALDINAAGSVVGMQLSYLPAPSATPLYWSAGGPVPLGSLGGQLGAAEGINADGTIVGWSANAAGKVRAFVWDQHAMMTELPPLPGDNDCEAYDIGPDGTVVGRSGSATAPMTAVGGEVLRYNFFEAWPTCWYNDGTVHALPTLGGTDGCVYARNAVGEMVGYCTDAGGRQRAVMWRPTPSGYVAQDLNDNLDPCAGFTHMVAHDINFLGTTVGWGRYDGQAEDRTTLMVPRRKARMFMTGGPLGAIMGGMGSILGMNHGVHEGLDGGTLICPSGYDGPDGSSVRYQMRPLDATTATTDAELVIDAIEKKTSLQGAYQTQATATYDAAGRVLEVVQANCDPCQSDDVFSFTYDDQGRLTEVVRSVEDVPQNCLSLSAYEDDAPPMLRKRPGRAKYSDILSGEDELDVTTTYDTQGRLVSLRYHRPNDHIGQFNFGYDTSSRILTMDSGKDNDCDGVIDNMIMNALATYDNNGDLIYLYDSVSDRPLLEKVPGTLPNADDDDIVFLYPEYNPLSIGLPRVKVEMVTSGSQFSAGVDDDLYVMLQLPESPELPVEVRRWNWYSEQLEIPDRNINSYIYWSSVDFLGTAPAGYTIVMPGNPYGSPYASLYPVNAAGLLAGTVGDDSLNICLYAGRKRPIGIRVMDNGDIQSEYHFYDRAADGSVISMITISALGDAIVSVGNNAKEEEEKSTFNFFECWPSALNSGGSTAHLNFFEAWPSDLYGGCYVQPLLPLYSRDGAGEKYVAGSVTPTGVYTHFSHDNSGEAVASIPMNTPAGVLKTSGDIPGDTNGDGRVDLLDLAVVAFNWLYGT